MTIMWGKSYGEASSRSAKDAEEKLRATFRESYGQEAGDRMVTSMLTLGASDNAPSETREKKPRK